MMTLEELAKALGLDTEENKDKLPILKKEFNAKEKATKELTKKVETLEADVEKGKASTEKLDIVKKAFDLDMDAEDFDEMLDSVKENMAKSAGGGVTPDEIKALKRDLTKATREKDKAVKELETLNTQLTEEKNTRIKNNVRSEIRKALDTNKVIKPNQMMDLFANRVNVDEDGSTFTIKTDDGSELSIMDYVADWSKDNPEFVKVETKGGSGTGLFDKAGGGNKAPQSDADKFMADILATAKPVETKSLGEAFGGR